jgi:Gas vesicle protein G
VGLIEQLVLLPVAPLRFTVWVAGYVAEEADRQEFSQEAAVRKLEGIRAARERGELGKEQAEELETGILQQQMERANQGDRSAGGPGG